MVAVGAAVGAPARYLTDRAVQSRHSSTFPWGTLTVNVIASLILGAISGAAGDVSADVAALIGAGFCGALSTFSTFSYETMRLGQQRARGYAVANVGVSIVAGLGAVALGWAVGAAVL